jgi:hypothetical protein
VLAREKFLAFGLGKGFWHTRSDIPAGSVIPTTAPATRSGTMSAVPYTLADILPSVAASFGTAADGAAGDQQVLRHGYRAVVTLNAAAQKTSGVEAVFGLTYEIDGGARPACVADVVVLYP